MCHQQSNCPLPCLCHQGRGSPRKRLENARPTLCVARFLCNIGGRACAKHRVRSCPALSHFMHENFDLAISQRSAGTLRKRRHKRTANSERRGMTHRVLACNGQINRICQCKRRVAFAVLTVASRAVLPVKHREVAHLLWFEFNVSRRSVCRADDSRRKMRARRHK